MLVQISTKTVNKPVDKHPLDTPEPRWNAAFNNLPVARAIFIPHKIKALRSQAEHESRNVSRLKENNFCE
jgi:hypothetical protein